VKSAAGSPVEEVLSRAIGGSDLGVLLDLGCGDGGFLDDLLSAASAREVWGLDPDEDALSEARRYFVKAGPDIPYYFFRGSSLSPDLPRGDFDTISFQDMLHHLSPGSFSHEPDERSRKALLAHLESADRLLTPGGRIILSEYVTDDDNPPARQGRIGIHNIKAEIDWLHGISHSYTFAVPALEDFVTRWLDDKDYEIEACRVLETQREAVMPGREDRALEDTLEYFSRYLKTIDELVDTGKVGGDLRSDLERRFEALRSLALTHGLLAQKRLLIIARKPSA
jgi:SAM-dependent methyltransferase